MDKTQIEDRSIYRVDAVKGQARRFLGTAFAVSADFFVTCKHVFDTLQEDEKCLIYSTAGEGDVLATWLHHDSQDFSMARREKAASKFYLTPQPIDVYDLDGEFTIRGYVKDGGGLQTWHDRLSGWNHDDGWVALQGAALPGMSGAPVLYDCGAVGLVRATREGGSQKFIVPFRLVYQWMQKNGFVPEMVGDGSGDLARVPIGPIVRPPDFPDCVIELFVDVFGGHREALRHVAAASALVLANNPEGLKSRQLIVTPGQLPTGGAMDTFWQDALWTAGTKSRRTLAAFFEAPGAPSPDLLDPKDAEAFRRFHRWVRDPNYQRT